MRFSGSALLRDTLTMILAGGQGERLAPLTEFRTKPSVPFGGKYRIIDFTLSNCLNSGLRKIYVLTQYKSDSLNQHLYEAWNIFNPELGEFIYSVPPQHKTGGDWYLGTANAIEQNENLIISNRSKWLLALSGDHIYKMDYLKMLHYHEDNNADATLAVIDYPKDMAERFGTLSIESNYKVTGFYEKIKEPPEIPDKQGFVFVNMGIYVFSSDKLINIFKEMDKQGIPKIDFGKHILPFMVKTGYNVFAYKFEDENKKSELYWRDIGTLDSYYAASMDLISVNPEFNLYDSEWPLRTAVIQSPPAKTLSHEGERVGRSLNSLICDGTIVSGGLVERSIVGHNVRINSYSYITDSIIFDNCKVGRHARIRRAIIDKNVVVPEGYEIGFDPEEDRKKFIVTETGIVVIPKNTVLTK
jgi:glucose-1-phosphate adenylyltransferase